MLSLLKDRLVTIIENINSLKISLYQPTKELLTRIQKGDKVALSTALLTFSRIYYDYYKEKTIILIDEYEAPLLNAINMGFEEEAINFFRLFFSSALKTNDYLEKCILSGITKLSHANIFSGLNNLNIFDYNKKEFADTFGFTQQEVIEALNYYKVETDLNKIKDYYDGYNFGGLSIYNPWSILNFLSEKELNFYWTKSSSSKIIINLLKNSSKKIQQNFLKLTNNESLDLDDDPNMLELEDIKNPNKLFCFMVITGYLNHNIVKNKVSVVNKEVLYSLSSISSKAFFKVPENFDSFMNSFKLGRFDRLENDINMLFEETFSYCDTTSNSSEKEYHQIMLALLAATSYAKVVSNREAGSGRFDIAINSYDPNYYSYIIEIKNSANEKQIDNILRSAIEQIKSKRYHQALNTSGKKAIIALCFNKRKVKIKYELI